MVLFRCYPVCNFGLGTVKSERVKLDETTEQVIQMKANAYHIQLVSLALPSLYIQYEIMT